MKPLDPQQLKTRTFKARKQIVVSGGTLSSPLILQRSGIGDPEKLKAAGVECKVDLPGVGLNFQDHYLTFSAYRAKPGTESFDDFVRGEPEVQKRKYPPAFVITSHTDRPRHLRRVESQRHRTPRHQRHRRRC